VASVAAMNGENEKMTKPEIIRDELAAKEMVYEPKYGGKDHSGYNSMMMYEVNYEREECFVKGWNASSELYTELINSLEDKLKWMEVYKDQNKAHLSFTILREALDAIKFFRGDK
jgi:hypothetical protein